ncbi:MAG TPA: SAM-dependent methyltransferase [Sphingomicrobium sp.]|nr:SAM-dependent methyltransferase [Sphingomicrobium sp.]
MTPLERALRERIAGEGPISVEAFMEACNAYYYATRDPLGAAGDFTTAPEVSQMFGELVGGCLADCWKRSGRPADAIYAELGPGRGTLAADALRVLRSGGFRGEVHFVETSPVLREVQGTAVDGAQWHDSVEDLPAKPLLLVANEFLDALPLRQFVGEVERRILIAAGGLAFDRDGEIVEDSPARTEAITRVAWRLVESGGAALFIDYGHSASAPGDTLQAVRRHRFAPVLEKPGEQDLTAHVDFEQVARAARDAGAAVRPVVSQGEWLIRLGIEVRAQALSRANSERAHDIEAALHRLTSSDAMGTLFKVIGIHSPEWPAPAAFE